MVIQLSNGNVEFRFYRPEARRVSVAGDFNDWNTGSLPMKLGSDGWWRCQLRIAPGCYHFRYVSDGQWLLDYAAFGLDYGPHGLNSVVCIEAPPVVSPAVIRGRAVNRCRKTSVPNRPDTAVLAPEDDSLRPPGSKAALPQSA